LEPPTDSAIAVVGDGFGSLIVYATALYFGFAPEQIAIYGTNTSPVATYQQYAYNLGQTVLRSESESHFLPADWPTFAQLDAWSRRSAQPLLRSIRRRYNPGVSEILTEATVVAGALGWDACRVRRRVGWLQREFHPGPHFVLYDEEANLLGRSRHVMIALGHGPLMFPPALAAAKADPALADRIVQAYEPKLYSPQGRYVVVGAGIASVNEWCNALSVGGKVISLLRGGTPDEQDLNTPRCLFEALGIDVFQGLSFEKRIAFLGQILKGTSPKRRTWASVVERGRAEGRFEELRGEIDAVEAGPAGLRVHIATQGTPDLGWLDVTGVVAGTGFQKSVLTLPLLRRLIQFYELPVEDGRLRLRRNCGIPRLDLDESRLCTMGLVANNVIPHGDTIAGLKYIGRRFVADCARAERIRRRHFASRMRMQLRLASLTAAEMRKIRTTEQLA
jgi:hypothetical protein